MPTNPTGPLTLPLSHLRVLVANSAAFRTWVGAADVAAALNSIFLVSLTRPANNREYTLAELQGLRPFALVSFAPRTGFDSNRIALGTYADGGRLTLQFEDDVASGDAADYAEAQIKFLNNVGATISEMKTLADTGGYLAVRHFRVLRGPERSPIGVLETKGDYQRILIEVEW